jgi:hypothetical protein
MTEEHIRYDLQPPARFSAWVGVVLLFVIFGFFVLVVIGAMPRGSDYETTRARARMEKLAEVRKEADKALGTYGWADKQKGVVHIPIERAMQVTRAELAVQKPTVAGPIATPAPAAPAAPAASPSSNAAQPNPGDKPVPAPMQQPAGTPAPAAGATPTP